MQNATVGSAPPTEEQERKQNKKTIQKILGGFVVVALVLIFISMVTNKDGFSQKNYDYNLRQKSNPFSWSTTQHESQTYQIPKSVPVFKPSRGSLTKYMSTRNPSFD
jgi:hypothetical protein